MRALWVKKTIYRRYLIPDDDIDTAIDMLKHDGNGDDFIANFLDKNNDIEYDNEKIFIPIDFEIKEI